MKFLDGQTVGIDLGTTYSAIAQLDNNGEPRVLNNADNRPITPSVVLLGDEGRVMVGPSFERISIEQPDHVVEAVKREMGNKDYYKVYQNKKLTPEFISALIVKKLKQDAESSIGPIANAVLTVPYYFNDVRRKATQDAGRIAGLNVVDIINEPTAATLAYAWKIGELGRTDLAQKEKTILVYDLGGGTFDVTVVKYTPTHFRVLATDGDVMLGGLDWSARLVDHVAEQFQRKFGEDPKTDPESLRVFTQECEDAKRDLSDKAQVPISVYHKGKTLTVALTRGDFERMTADLLQRTKDTTELVMQQAGINPSQLDDVILVGGSTYMPVVEQMLREICKREPSRTVIPEEAVAQGAAIHAAILEARTTGGESRMAAAIIKRLRSVNTEDESESVMDVYKEWLGIPDGDRPPDHYTLLRLVEFEDDPDKIRKNYTKLNGHVRKYASGQYSVQSQELLNELAKAMLCLTDIARKREYDESLGRDFDDETDSSGRKSLGKYLVDEGHVSAAQMSESESFAEARGLELRDAVVQMKLVDQETATRALAAELGFSYVDPSQLIPDDSVLDKVPRNVVKRNSCLPLFIDDDVLLVACIHEPTTELEEEFRLRFGVPMRPVLATPLAINQALATYYAPGMRDEAADEPSASKGKSGKTKKSAKSSGRKAAAGKADPEEQRVPLRPSDAPGEKKLEFLIPRRIVQFLHSLPAGDRLQVWETLDMTRIGSITSTGADQIRVLNRLARVGNDLTDNLTRLSTLKRINSAKDDPAGLISATTLERELTAVETASRSLTRAGSVLNTADKAAEEIVNGLQSARALILASIGTGVSSSEVAANQLQIDTILGGINSLAQTEFGGQQLLNGASGFTTDGINAAEIVDIDVLDKAPADDVAVDITIDSAATQATNSYTGGTLTADATLVVSGPEGTTTINLGNGADTQSIADAFNAVADVTGVNATRVDAGEVEFRTSDYGSEALLSIESTEGNNPMWLNLIAFFILTAGHTELQVTLVNRLHAGRISCGSLRRIRHVHDVLIPLFPLMLVWFLGIRGPGLLVGGSWSSVPIGWWIVCGLCGVGFAGLVVSTVRWWLRRVPAQQLDQRSQIVDLVERLGEPPIGQGPLRWLTKFPGNEIFQIEVGEKEFLLPRLPAEWDGLSILHLSDLHMIGTITKPFFEEIARLAQQAEADLIVFTGDLLDKQSLKTWLPDTLGTLNARLGCYYILGNHDWFLVAAETRAKMSELGWDDLSDRTITIDGADIAAGTSGTQLIIGGTELPWMGDHPEFSSSNENEFRLLLSHSPDNLPWAKANNVDLMLSGHNHGGQVVLPIVGPVYSPSRFGVRYASGTFWEPPTLLHVTRGLSSQHPLRLRCRPELAKLILRSDTHREG
eukprot:g21910.t1